MKYGPKRCRQHCILVIKIRRDGERDSSDEEHYPLFSTNRVCRRVLTNITPPATRRSTLFSLTPNLFTTSYFYYLIRGRCIGLSQVYAGVLGNKILHTRGDLLGSALQVKVVRPSHLCNLHLRNPIKQFALLSIGREGTIFCLNQQYRREDLC